MLLFIMVGGPGGAPNPPAAVGGAIPGTPGGVMNVGPP